MARKDKDFLGLEVISLEDASVIGEVDALVVDETTNSLAGLIVDLGIYEAKGITFADITSIGEDAVTVESAASVKPISEQPGLLEIAERDVQITDALVMTDGGNIVGTAGDYYLDPSTGAVKGVEILVDEEAGEKSLLVPASQVVRIGTDLVLVRQGFETTAVPTPEAL